jgi:hypothetical protein
MTEGVSMSEFGGPSGPLEKLHKDGRAQLTAALQTDEVVRAVVVGNSGSGLVVTSKRVFAHVRPALGLGRATFVQLGALDVRRIEVDESMPPCVRVELFGEVVRPRIPSPTLIPLTKGITGLRVDRSAVEAAQAALFAAQDAARSAGEEPNDPAAATELRSATRDWTAPSLFRKYESGDAGQHRLEGEMDILGLHGYEADAQSEDGGHVHVGRIFATGGLSILAGSRGTRSKGAVSVTYKRVAAPVVADGAPPAGGGDIAEMLRKIAELHDAGILSDAEFGAKKADLLSRM